MLRKIEALRKEPKHVRNRYAFWIAFLCTIVIASIWAVSLPARFSKSTQAAHEATDHLSSFSRAVHDVTDQASSFFVSATHHTSTTSASSTVTHASSSVRDFRSLAASSSASSTPATSSIPVSSQEVLIGTSSAAD